MRVVVVLISSRDLDADEFFVCSVGDLISLFLEYLYDGVPFVKIVLRTEPPKDIAMCYDYHWFLCRCPFEE
jgi:hypothetical protein